MLRKIKCWTRLHKGLLLHVWSQTLTWQNGFQPRHIALCPCIGVKNEQVETSINSKYGELLVKRVDWTYSALNFNRQNESVQMRLFNWFDCPIKARYRKCLDLRFKTSFWTPYHSESPCFLELPKELFKFFLFTKLLRHYNDISSPEEAWLAHLQWFSSFIVVASKEF